ncbi:MAG: MarR family transcriptional regulator [Dehalococcoidia bacterium]|nr:MarR family transcriptional regulator [Dehalococcoidia bacterium]
MQEKIANFPRSDLLITLQSEIRAQSATTLFFHQAVADRLGLSPSDHKCLDAIMQAGSMTPGEIARQTRLTTGAVTGVIDRLEREGLVRREHDSDDRRRVIVRPASEEAICQCAALFEPVRRSFEALCSQYSDDELRLLIDFARKSQALLQDETEKVRAADPAGPLPDA